MKLDVTGIQGYADMSAEEKVAALEGLDLPEPQSNETEILKLKNALNKASTDVANYKKQLQARMSDEEAKESARKEQQEQMEQELAGYRKAAKVNQLASQYRAMGYTDDLAMKRATAVEDGNTDEAISCEKAFLEAMKKASEEAALQKQPPLSGGSVLTSKQIEDEQIAKLRKAMGV